MGCTPLHRAASAGHTEVADVLIEEGADLEVSDNEGQTPLMLATICDNRQVCPTCYFHVVLVMVMLLCGHHGQLPDQ